MITLKQLRYLTALAEHRHFGKAAEACAVTQPALSMQIRELEKDLGADLVERRPGEVMLTETGAEVARRAERVLAAARDLTDFARHSGRLLTGRLRLGVIPTLAPYVLPQILPALQRRFPDLRVELRETQTRTLMDELARGALDAVLLALPVEEGDIETLRAVRRSVPARGAGGRCARSDSARVDARDIDQRAADPAGGRTLPARSGAGVLRRRARDTRVGARRDLALDRDADGGERLRRHAAAADRARCRSARRARQAAALPRSRARAHRSGLRGGAPRRARPTSRRSARSCATSIAHEQAHVAVIGAGPAGLMAAEVLAQRRRAGDGLRPHAVGGAQVPDGRARRAQSHAQRGDAARFSRAMARRQMQLRAAIEAFPPDALRAWSESAGPVDLRRVERTGVSARHEGLAAAARVAAPARCGGRAVRVAASRGPGGMMHGG